MLPFPALQIDARGWGLGEPPLLVGVYGVGGRGVPEPIALDSSWWGTPNDRWRQMMYPGWLAGNLVKAAMEVRQNWRAPRTVAVRGEPIR